MATTDKISGEHMVFTWKIELGIKKQRWDKLEKNNK